MSRYSPTVAPARGEDFGSVLADSVLSFVGARQEKQDRQRAEEDRQRKFRREDESDAIAQEAAGRQRILDALTLYNQGYREGAPPEAAPGQQLADIVASQRGNVTQAGTAAPAGPPRGNLTQDPGFQPHPSSAVPLGGGYQAPPSPMQPSPLSPPSRIQQAATQFYRVGGGYVDPTATPDARRAAAAAAEDERRAAADRENDERGHGYRLDEERAAHGFRSQEDEARYKRDREIHQMDNASRERQAGIRTAGRGGAGGAGAAGEADPTDDKTLDKRAGMVNQQIGNAQRSLDDESKRLDNALLMDPSATPDSSAYHDIAATIDSLRGVQNTVSAARGGDAQAQATIRRQRAESVLREKRQRLLNMGVDPAKVDAALQEDLARLGTEYGATPTQPAAPRWHPPMVRPAGGQRTR